MKINVAQQLKQPIGLSQSYEIGEMSGGFPLQGQVKLLRTQRSILVQGTVKTTVKTECSRCLQEFDCPLTLGIEEEYFPTKDVLTGAPLPVPEDCEGFTIDEDQDLDLGEAVRQYTLLTLPMKPVCQPECRGLCPSCGANLNRGPCTCTRQPEPRWTPLETLREDSRAKRARNP